MIIAIWIITALLLALWSAAAWGLHALLAGGVAWLGELEPLLRRIPYSDVVERWIPGWIDALKLAVELMQQALGWLGGAAPVLVWVVWALGALALLGVAALLSLVVALVRKSTPPAGGTPPPAGGTPSAPAST